MQFYKLGMAKKGVLIRMDEEAHNLFKQIANTEGITFSGLVSLTLSQYARNKNYTKAKINDRIISSIQIQIARDRMRDDNFKGYLANNTLEAIKLQALFSLRFNHDLNMSLIKNTIRNAFNIYKHFPPKNKRLIKSEMEALRGLINKNDLWVFLTSRFPTDFQPFKRHLIEIPTKRPIEFKPESVA